MPTYLLVRHAHHDALGNTIAGWTPGIHLSIKGREQAERLADRLAESRASAVYSSPLERTLETAEAIGRRLSLSVRVREAFGEIHFGDWTGKTFDELSRDECWRLFNTFRSGTRAPNGELMLEVQARVIAALQDLALEHPDETVVVVSHGDVIRAALAHYAGIHLDLFQRFEISPASVSAIRLHNYGPQILRVNETV